MCSHMIVCANRSKKNYCEYWYIWYFSFHTSPRSRYLPRIPLCAFRVLPSSNVGPKRRLLPIHVRAGQREPKRCCLADARYKFAAALCAEPLSFRVEVEGASRRNVTRIPSPVPSAPASRGPMARRRRFVLYFSPSSSSATTCRGLARSLAQTIAPSLLVSRLAASHHGTPSLSLALIPSPFSPCVSDSFLSPFSVSRPFYLSLRSYTGCLVPSSTSSSFFRSLSLSFGRSLIVSRSLALSLSSSSLLLRHQPPSRCRAPMTVAVRHTRGGRREEKKEARVTLAFWLGIVTGRSVQYVRAAAVSVYLDTRESERK